jgi:heterodisulfide reductase subunit C
MNESDCPQCSSLAEPIKFTWEMYGELKQFHERLILEFVQKGILKIAYGDLQWSECIECGLCCSKCGRRFQFFASSKGSGDWRPVLKFA